MRRPSATVATLAAAAALRVDGVVGLDAGPLGTRVTYGSGGRVQGVTVRDDGPGRTVTLYLSVSWGPPIVEVAERARTEALVALDAAFGEDGPWRVDVEVTDVAALPSGEGSSPAVPAVDALGAPVAAATVQSALPQPTTEDWA